MTINSDEQKLHVLKPPSVPRKKTKGTSSQAVCSEPAPPQFLVTDMRFINLRADQKCAACERIQNRAIQTVKLKKGDGPIKPKDLQDFYSRESTPDHVSEITQQSTPEPQREQTNEPTG